MGLQPVGQDVGVVALVLAEWAIMPCLSLSLSLSLSVAVAVAVAVAVRAWCLSRMFDCQGRPIL